MKNKKLTLTDCQNVAAIQKGKCLSKHYKNNREKLLWECENNHTWLACFSHIQSGTWCPVCRKKDRVLKNKHSIEFVLQFIKNSNLTPLFTEYQNNKALIKCQCNTCKYIWDTTFDRIKSGHNCPKCSVKNRSEKRKHSIDFVKEIIQKNNGTLLSKEYMNRKDDLSVQCNRCNFIWMPSLNNIMQGKWCPKCFKTISTAQCTLADFIGSLGFEVISNSRRIIPPLELDIFIQQKNIAIEYCGLYWHREQTPKDRKRHLNKMNECKKQNIQLITIFEDEWLTKQEQVKGYLKAILGKTNYKIHARKCEIKNVETCIAKDFHNNNHIQGAANGTHIGLFFNNDLVCLATFAKPSASRNTHKNNQNKIELMRYTVKVNYSVRGGLGKIISYYTKQNPPIEQIISYSDNRWSNGNIYYSLNFDKISNGSPSYYYFKNGKIERFHRYNFTKHKAIALYGGSKDNTEWEIMSQNGWDRIWDCGSSKWVLKIKPA